MSMGRVVLLAVLSGAGCGGSFNSGAHVGRDGTPLGATPLVLGPPRNWPVRARTPGVVTARGGDRVDWYRFDVSEPAGCDCASTRVKLTWRPPRPGLRLAMNVYGADLRRLARVLPPGGRTSLHWQRDEMPAGRYYLEVYAPGGDDAADYVLSVDAESEYSFHKCPDLPPPVVHLSRPADAALAAGAATPLVADIAAIDGEAPNLWLTLDRGSRHGLKAGWHGVLVRADGTAVSDGAIQLLQVSDTSSVARVDADALARFDWSWRVVLWP